MALYDPEAASWNPNLYVKNALGDVKEEVVCELVDHLDQPIYMLITDNMRLFMSGKSVKWLEHFGKNSN